MPSGKSHAHTNSRTHRSSSDRKEKEKGRHATSSTPTPKPDFRSSVKNFLVPNPQPKPSASSSGVTNPQPASSSSASSLSGGVSRRFADLMSPRWSTKVNRGRDSADALTPRSESKESNASSDSPAKWEEDVTTLRAKFMECNEKNKQVWSHVHKVTSTNVDLVIENDILKRDLRQCKKSLENIRKERAELRESQQRELANNERHLVDLEERYNKLREQQSEQRPKDVETLEKVAHRIADELVLIKNSVSTFDVRLDDISNTLRSRSRPKVSDRKASRANDPGRKSRTRSHSNGRRNPKSEETSKADAYEATRTFQGGSSPSQETARTTRGPTPHGAATSVRVSSATQTTPALARNVSTSKNPPKGDELPTKALATPTRLTFLEHAHAHEHEQEDPKPISSRTRVTFGHEFTRDDDEDESGGQAGAVTGVMDSNRRSTLEELEETILEEKSTFLEEEDETPKAHRQLPIASQDRRSGDRNHSHSGDRHDAHGDDRHRSHIDDRHSTHVEDRHRTHATASPSSSRTNSYRHRPNSSAASDSDGAFTEHERSLTPNGGIGSGDRSRGHAHRAHARDRSRDPHASNNRASSHHGTSSGERGSHTRDQSRNPASDGGRGRHPRDQSRGPRRRHHSRSPEVRRRLSISNADSASDRSSARSPIASPRSRSPPRRRRSMDRSPSDAPPSPHASHTRSLSRASTAHTSSATSSSLREKVDASTSRLLDLSESDTDGRRTERSVDLNAPRRNNRYFATDLRTPSPVRSVGYDSDGYDDDDDGDEDVDVDVTIAYPSTDRRKRTKRSGRSLERDNEASTTSRNDPSPPRRGHLSARSVQPHPRKFSYASNRRPISPISFPPVSALARSQSEHKSAEPHSTPSAASSPTSSVCLSPMGSFLSVSPPRASPPSRQSRHRASSHARSSSSYTTDRKSQDPPEEKVPTSDLDEDRMHDHEHATGTKSNENIEKRGTMHTRTRMMSVEQLDDIDKKLAEIVARPMRPPVPSFPRPLEPTRTSADNFPRVYSQSRHPHRSEAAAPAHPRFEVATPAHPPRATHTPLNTPCDGLPQMQTKQPSTMAAFAHELHLQSLSRNRRDRLAREDGISSRRRHTLSRNSAAADAADSPKAVPSSGTATEFGGGLPEKTTTEASARLRERSERGGLFSSPATKSTRHPTSHFSAPSSRRSSLASRHSTSPRGVHLPKTTPPIVRRASDVSDIRFSTPWRNYTLSSGVGVFADRSVASGFRPRYSLGSPSARRTSALSKDVGQTRGSGVLPKPKRCSSENSIFDGKPPLSSVNCYSKLPSLSGLESDAESRTNPSPRSRGSPTERPLSRSSENSFTSLGAKRSLHLSSIDRILSPENNRTISSSLSNISSFALSPRCESMPSLADGGGRRARPSSSPRSHFPKEKRPDFGFGVRPPRAGGLGLRERNSNVSTYSRTCTGVGKGGNLTSVGISSISDIGFRSQNNSRSHFKQRQRLSDAISSLGSDTQLNRGGSSGNGRRSDTSPSSRSPLGSISNFSVSSSYSSSGSSHYSYTRDLSLRNKENVDPRFRNRPRRPSISSSSFDSDSDSRFAVPLATPTLSRDSDSSRENEVSLFDRHRTASCSPTSLPSASRSNYSLRSASRNKHSPRSASRNKHSPRSLGSEFGVSSKAARGSNFGDKSRPLSSTNFPFVTERSDRERDPLELAFTPPPRNSRSSSSTGSGTHSKALSSPHQLYVDPLEILEGL